MCDFFIKNIHQSKGTFENDESIHEGITLRKNGTHGGDNGKEKLKYANFKGNSKIWKSSPKPKPGRPRRNSQIQARVRHAREKGEQVDIKNLRQNYKENQMSEKVLSFSRLLLTNLELTVIANKNFR